MPNPVYKQGAKVYDCPEDGEKHTEETLTEWREFIDKMNSGEHVFCTVRIFDYFLGVLPPAWMGRIGSMNFETLHDGLVCPRFCFAEGAERMTAFGVCKGTEIHWAVRTLVWNPHC